LSPLHARLFGVLLASPLPLGLLAAELEAVYLIFVAVIAVIVARIIRRVPQQPANSGDERDRRDLTSGPA